MLFSSLTKINHRFHSLSPLFPRLVLFLLLLSFVLQARQSFPHTLHPTPWEKTGFNASSSLLGDWHLMSSFTAPNSSSSFWGGTCRCASKHLFSSEHYLSPSFRQANNQKLHALNGLKFSVWTSRGAGLVLAYTGGLILLPMLRNIIRIIRPKLTWLFPADENIWFHRQVAYSMAFWAMVHTTAHYINFLNVERTRTYLVAIPLAPLTIFVEVRTQIALQIHYTQPGAITGHFMLFMMLLMYSTAHHKIRAQCFEAFWYTHHLAFFFMIGLYTHATGCFVRDSVNPDYIPTFPFYSTQHCLGYESWRFIIWPGIFYFGERVYREIRARRTTRLSKLLVHPSGSLGCKSSLPSF